MKKNLIAMACVGAIGLAGSVTAIAALTPFAKSLGDDYYCGYKNDAGKVIIPANKYDGCGEFSDGLAYVGHIAKPLVEYETGGYKHVQGFIDTTGKVVIPVKYEAQDGMDSADYRSFSEGLVTVFKNGKYGYMDKQQKLVIPHQYEQAMSFSDGVAVVANDGLYGVINKAGKVAVPLKYNYVGSFSNGLAVVSVEQADGDILYGYINKQGKVTIKPQWYEAMGFSEGLAAVSVDSENGALWGVIDAAGNYVIKPKYHAIIPEIGNDSQSFEKSGYFKDGKIDFYQYVNPNDPENSKITRHTVNKAGKVLASKTYNDWDSVAKAVS